MPNTSTAPSGRGAVNFATAGKVIAPVAIKPAKLATMVQNLDLKSIEAGARSLSAIKLQPRQVSPLMSDVFKGSQANALTLSKAVLKHAQSSPGNEDHARALFQWARQEGREQRQMVCQAFRQAKLDVVAVHHIAELTQKDARSYMKDYFEAGGDLKSVLQWLEIAGGVLRQNVEPKKEGTAGDAVKWVENKVKEVAGKVVDAAKNMINTVADALKAAGKSLAHVVEEAAKWTAGKLADVVHALINAGKTVAALLAEAVKLGLDTMEKFVKAVLAAGRTILSVLEWAAGKTMNVVNAVMKALLAAGRKVADVLAQAIKLASHALKQVVQALYKLGKKVGEILVSVASAAVSITRTVLEGLFAIGVQLVDAVAAICTNVVVIMEVFGGHRPLNAEETKEARKVFGWSIPLERVKLAVASVPADVVNWINGNRTVTTMYVINFASWVNIDQNMHTLIHELTHVWQATTVGPVYMVEAICSQLAGRGYNVTDADLARANGDFNKLEREQQAVVVENYWWGRFGGNASIDWKKYQALAAKVFKPQPRIASAGLRTRGAAA